MGRLEALAAAILVDRVFAHLYFHDGTVAIVTVQDFAQLSWDTLDKVRRVELVEVAR